MAELVIEQVFGLPAEPLLDIMLDPFIEKSNQIQEMQVS